MSIFGMFKSKDEDSSSISSGSSSKKFTKTVLVTRDVTETLESLAKIHNISSKVLDIKVLSNALFYKTRKQDEFKKLPIDQKEKFYEEKNILHPNLEITQELKLEVFKRKAGNKFPIKIILGGNKSFTKIVVHIKKQDNVQYFDGLGDEILSEINRKKARLNILLDFFDDGVDKEIKKLVSHIRVNNAILEDFSFVVCKGIEATSLEEQRIIRKYEEKEIVDQEDKIDHSDRSFIHSVKKGDTILIVVDEKEEKFGRNVKGELIEPDAVQLNVDEKPVDIKVTNDFKITKDGDKILYIAKRNGFINEKEKNSFEINDELVVNEISFKSTGSINGSTDGDVKLNIQGKDVMRDAIGQGMNIETTELTVGGNVGSAATVRAKLVDIGGQVHQSARIFGENVKVNIHKGYIEGGNIEINSLESGKVVGDIVTVKTLVGGEIIAKEIHVGIVTSNATLTASDIIEMNSLNGSGNIFTIDPLAHRGFKERMDSLTQKIGEKNETITQLTKKIKAIRRKIENEKEKIGAINEKIAEFKATKIQIPAAFMIKLKEQQEHIKKHNLLLKELKDVKIEKSSLDKELEELESAYVEAKVINNSKWKEFNEIKFKIINPAIEMAFLPKEGEVAKTITIEQVDDDDGYEIKKR
jgi:uncharacterized coiled-coil protein SlyX